MEQTAKRWAGAYSVGTGTGCPALHVAEGDCSRSGEQQVPLGAPGCETRAPAGPPLQSPRAPGVGSDCRCYGLAGCQLCVDTSGMMVTQTALWRLGRVGESVTTCGPATNPLCALEQVTSVFGPQFTICKKTSPKGCELGPSSSPSSWTSSSPG